MGKPFENCNNCNKCNRWWWQVQIIFGEINFLAAGFVNRNGNVVPLHQKSRKTARAAGATKWATWQCRLGHLATLTHPVWNDSK